MPTFAPGTYSSGQETLSALGVGQGVDWAAIARLLGGIGGGPAAGARGGTTGTGGQKLDLLSMLNLGAQGMPRGAIQEQNTRVSSPDVIATAVRLGLIGPEFSGLLG
jgi:hypothetical protein